MNIKNFLVVFAIVGVLLAYNKVFAEEVSFIDMSKIMTSYTKAQALSTDLKNKEAELQKLISTAKNDIKSSKITEQKQIEVKYNKELKEKQALYKQQYLEELKNVQADIEKAVGTVAKNKNIKLIYNKTSIVFGGTDLTNDVLDALKNSN